MSTTRLALAWLLVLAAAAGAVAGQAQEPGTRIQADLFAREDPDILYAIGHVRLERGGSLITADGAVVWTQDQEAYLEGHVVYRTGKSVFQAERAYVHWTTTTDRKTGEQATAIDRGFIVRGDVRWHERPDKVGWRVRATEVLQTDIDRFCARGSVVLSPCGYHEPHVYFRATEVRFVAGEKIIVKNLTYHVQGVALDPDIQGWWIPPLYWPKLYIPLGWRWPEMTFDVGSKSRFGTYVQTEVLYELPEPLVAGLRAKVGARVDYYSKRGFGLGGSFRYYDDHDRVRGLLDYYRVGSDDGEDFDEFDLGKTNRYRLRFTHSQDYVPEGWEFDVEYQRWSDAGFRQEFFEPDFYEEKPVESRVYVKWADGPFAAYLHTRWQEDEWLDTTEYLPQFGLNVFSYPLWRNLVYTGHIEAANVHRQLSELRLPPSPTAGEIAANRALAFRRNFFHDPLESTLQEFASDDRRFWRFNTYHELAMPFEVSIFDIEPFAGVRATWYEETLPDHDSDWRTLVVWGVRASTQFWKSWNNVESDGLRLFGARLLPLEVHGIRHVVTPELRVLAVEDSGVEFDELILTDDDSLQPPADAGFAGFRLARTGPATMVSRPRLYYGSDSTALAFGDVNDVYPFRVVTLGLRNRWQTRRGGRVVDLIDIDADIDVFFGDRDVNNDDSSSDLRLDFRFHPIDGVSFFADFDYNVGGNDYLRRRRDGTLTTSDDPFSAFCTGLSIHTSKRWQLYLSQRYEAREANYLGIRLVYHLSEKWRVLVQYEYDTHESEDVELAFVISRDLHDWIAEFVLENDELSDERLIGFRLRPKGRGQLLRGLSYTRRLGEMVDARRQESIQHFDY